MSDVEEPRIEFDCIRLHDDMVLRRKRRKATGEYYVLALAFTVAVLLGVTSRLAPWASTRTELQPNGAEHQVYEYWNCWMHFANGNHPDWRRVTDGNGNVWEGFLQNGRRHGKWKNNIRGRELVVEYVKGGRVVHRKPSQEILVYDD